MTGLFSNMASSARAIAARLSPVRFAKRQDGTVTAFAMLIFVLMIGAGGIAIDVMRYETQRVQLQYTLDRAILAAASLTQPYDPEGVVRNYFEVSGIQDYRLDVRVEQGLNFRRVHAYAELEVRSMFMQLFGIRVMTSPAIGAAEERVNNIEVSMVLDISGSMGNNNRMTNLRPAAREFVTEVLRPNTLEGENLVTVSIVPYNGRVNSGALIGSVFTFDNLHNESNCARFPDSAFSQTAIDPAVAIPRISHWDRDNEDDDQLFSRPHCQTDGYAEILPWQHEVQPLHDHINALNTGGWTAIDLGMNWAVGLLDPAANPAVQGLIAAEHVHEDFAQRPAPFEDGDPTTQLDDETIKVVVLMTDGANTRQYDIRDEYRVGFAPIFRHLGADEDDPDDDSWSVWWEDQGQFWVPTDDPREPEGSWQNEPVGGWEAYGMLDTDGEVVDAWATMREEAFNPLIDRDGDGNPDELDGYALAWVDLWANYTAEYIAEEWLEEPARASGDWEYHDAVADNNSYNYIGWDGNYTWANGQVGRSEADRNLMAICDAAREAGIFVFSIGFEAPSNGQRVMQYCATTPAHYYDVDGVEISQAFDSIARAINQLRLIQ
ncbi:pilus assembly protein TadG-related protein [Gymnodinialimonas sp. 2305UL16-5]|uniref:pilus assembly protein TadG-related protein n=1 Tax=Gymnodinialimonas mytili TaxID=3126503 RepID=UPI0030B17D31